jgi:hypothetical protein
MKFKVVSITSLLALALCWSCAFHNVDDDLKSAPLDICSPSDTTTVSFQDTIFPIFTKYCSNNANGDCHRAAPSNGKPDYATYAGIKSSVDGGRVQARVIDDSNMPPPYSSGPKSMSDCEKTILLRWIAQGAKNN